MSPAPLLATLPLVLAGAQEPTAPGLERLAARCGSEVRIASSWDEAARRARSEGRAVLAVAWLYPGFALADGFAIGAFADPDVVELVRERFAVLRLARDEPTPLHDADVYGLGAMAFGAGAFVLTPEGELVRQGVDADYDFLVAALADLPAPPPPRGAPLERAAVHLARGELDAARGALDGAEGVAALRLRADLERRARDLDAATEALEAARRADADAAHCAELDADRARLDVLAGRNEEARELARHALDAHPGGPRVAELAWHLGAARLALEGRAGAEETWRELAREHPDSPHAWRAAALLTGVVWSLGYPPRFDLPAAQRRAEVAPPVYEPWPASRAAEAADGAATWLLAHQEQDGSWLVPLEVGRHAGAVPEHFELAITALGVRALLPRRADPDVERAVARALAWLWPALARQRAAGSLAHFMDYGVWSRAALIELLADGVEAGLLAPAAAAEHLASLGAELAERQRSGGGWSYYVKGDLEAAEPGPDQSISFTTAWIVLALLRAREAGIEPWPELADALLERGLDCLEELRREPGLYDYMVFHAPDGSLARRISTGEAGSAGRGPLCAGALWRGGRADLDEPRAGLELYRRFRGGLTAELGKVLIHAGPEGQGSHYVLFDHLHAAEAVALLPRRERARLAPLVREEVLAARVEGGAFVDDPGRGRAYGTASALLALDRLAAAD